MFLNLRSLQGIFNNHSKLTITMAKHSAPRSRSVKGSGKAIDRAAGAQSKEAYFRKRGPELKKEISRHQVRLFISTMIGALLVMKGVVYGFYYEEYVLDGGTLVYRIGIDIIPFIGIAAFIVALISFRALRKSRRSLTKWEIQMKKLERREGATLSASAPPDAGGD